MADPEQVDLERADASSWVSEGPAALPTGGDAVPELETDPAKSRVSLRKVSLDLGNKQPDVEKGERPGRKSMALREGLRDGDDTLVKIDFIPTATGAQEVTITGYGAAPRVVEVFPEEDLDDIIDAEEVQQIELNIETEAKQQMLNLDLSTEYQRPRLDRALEYRRLHMPTRPDGKQFSFWGTKTGRFIPKCLARCDLLGEGRKSDLIAFGPGVSAYFKFLKSLGWLFFFLCLLSLPILLVNMNGGSHFSNHPIPFAQTTLGNLYVSFNRTQFLLSNSSALDALNETIASEEYVMYTLRMPGFCSDSPEGCTFKRTDLILAYSIWDATICLLIVFTINLLVRFTRHETLIYKQKVPKIEDYSIQTSVPSSADAKSLQVHFESILRRISNKTGAVVLRQNFTEVYDIQIVESTGNAISLCIARGILLKKLARLDAKIKVMHSRGIHESRITPQVKKLDKIRDRITKLDEKAMHRAQKGRALHAFVTFQSQEARIRMLHYYDQFYCCGRQPESLRFNGAETITIKTAPPPSTLLWENQEISHRNRCLRLFFAIVLFASILGITAALSFVTDSNRVFAEVLDVASGENLVRCDGEYDHIISLADAAQAAKEDGNVQCFCDYEMFAPKPQNSPDNGFLFIADGVCANHAISKATSIGKEIGLSFVIVVINIVIFKVVIETAEFMKFQNVVDREFAILQAIFVITLINTAVICVLTNADWSRLTGADINDVELDDGTTVFQIGRFSDFEPGWYSRVGVEIFIIAVLNIFGPHMLPMLRYIYHVWERRYLAPHAVSQQVLNEMYIGEEFLLSVRLAQTLMMVFFVLIFSAGIPVLYWVGLASVVIAYWLDKFFFVRLVRTPPQFDTALQIWTIRTMEWAVIMHCLVGFWMFSSPKMFPLTDSEARESLVADLSQSLQITAQDAASVGSNRLDLVAEVQARFGRLESIIMLACAGFVLLIKFLRRFGRTIALISKPAHACMNMIRACTGRQMDLRTVNKYILQAHDFEEALKQNRVAGVRSYNILANPVYQRVFQMQDGLNEEREAESDGKSVGTKGTREANNYRGYQSLQDALNIRKGTAVSSIESRTIWRDDGKSSVNSAVSKQTTQLYTKKTTTSSPPSESGSVAGETRKSVKSQKKVDNETASTISSPSKAESTKTKSVKSTQVTFEEQRSSPAVLSTASEPSPVTEFVSEQSPNIQVESASPSSDFKVEVTSETKYVAPAATAPTEASMLTDSITIEVPKEELTLDESSSAPVEPSSSQVVPSEGDQTE